MNLRNYFYSLAIDTKNGFMAGIIKFFLFILSLLYGLVVRTLIYCQSLRPHRLNCKVVSVGNITLGGTGKTPLVELIAQYLKQQGRKVAISTRGYKREIMADDGRRTTDDGRQASYKAMGDEPSMLFKNLMDIPVIVDAKRIRAAHKAIENYKADTVILDDGFQQWKIKKDLEIVAIDAINPFGNRHMLPRGILREPLSSLRRAHLFVLTKTDLSPNIQTLKDFLSSINPQAQIIESIHNPMGFYMIHQPDKLLSADILKRKTVTLVCGIADPDSLEDIITRLGVNVGLSFRFPDHYAYQEKDIKDIARKSKEKKIDTMVTTEKDAVRIPLEALSMEINFFVLKIKLQITNNEKEFFNRI